MRKKYLSIIIGALIISISIGAYTYVNYKIDHSKGMTNIIKKNRYDASKEVNEALKSFDITKKSEVITNIDTQSNIVSLSFEGIKNKDTMEKVVDLLDKYNIKATFFIPGIKAAEDSSIVKMIKEGGHDIGNGTLSGNNNMENLSKEDLILDFSTTNKILKSITDKEVELLKCNSTMNNENVLASAFASGNKYVVSTDHYLSYQSFKNYEQAYGYIKNLSNGTIVSIKLDGVLNDFEYNKEIVEEKPAIDKQAGIKENKEDKEDERTITEIVEWVLKAIKEQEKVAVKLKEFPSIKKYNELNNIGIYNDGPLNNDKLSGTIIENMNNSNDSSGKYKDNKNNVDKIDFKELIDKNNGMLSTIVSRFYTTQEALSYTFRGLSNENVLDNVLASLDKYNAKGTFFVTKNEIINYPDRIEKIVGAGHEIGNGGITVSSDLLNKTNEEICKEIYEVDKLLKEKGIYTNSYMSGYGYSNSKVQEAISTINKIKGLENYELITYTKAPIISKYKDMNADQIIKDYFNVNSYVSLSKGEIVYFRLDSDLFKDNTVISNLIEILTENYVKNGYVHKYNKELQTYYLSTKPLNYSIVPLKDIQSNFESQSNFGRYNILTNIKSMEMKSYDEALKMIKTNYIGNEDVNLEDFSDDEKLNIDKTGTIDTNGESVIFFTFDDWGGDPIVNEILNVLNKHNVKAGFFTISKYVDINSGISNINPNLLRTIALNGHDIGSHNYNHELLDTNKAELEKSLIKSYDVMSNVIGDLDSLRQYFRPPTLLLKKEGLAAVFESGYKYTISGNISTHDYESTSSQEILDAIEPGLVEGRGNIIVMHMNNQSYYTAEALDKFLTNNENGVYGRKYKIAKLSDYLEQ
ncbi:polysaccharide deacetylase family protein [Clostridium tertium]|uniref:polysaccharide deacetylase family protein n=1 Tax=Clostridium tertium TaxID=1559 RepID=UPI00115B94AA|nr:polysaccharide deacetylase family protein [Clostridium tertium]MDB1955573.1 polysaccharide deacetylase family protein [Clostridium tertium]MDB1957038.1 polysaccharide deacetylase family protein [Clostridium tertium]MDB1961313.1 polysaccharide deacetylase family protein [Clostridium tertium]MDB1966848.1 polysaccharide deacetylase family protein [Clostridium tertium]